MLLLLVGLFAGCEKEDLVDAGANDLTDVTGKEAFDASIATGVSFVFFHASWCSNCFEQRPAVEAAQKNPAVSFARFIEVEYEDNEDITDAYNVPGFPTMVIFKDGVEKERFKGKGHTEQQFVDALLKYN